MAESVKFDRAAGFYDATRGFPPGVDERVAALLAEAGGLGAASQVLEIGIGTGRIALPLAARVARVAGVDLSVPMLEKLARKRGDAHVDPVRADATALPFASARFDAVVGVHVLHLIPGWRQALAEAARVLRPGGLYLHAADDRSADGSLGFSPHELVRALGYENAGVSHHNFETCPEEAGFVQVGAVHRIQFPRTLVPRAMIDRMADRSWSITWKMSDADLARLVASVRDELAARFGDLDREVEVETGFWVRAHRVA